MQWPDRRDRPLGKGNNVITYSGLVTPLVCTSGQVETWRLSFTLRSNRDTIKITTIFIFEIRQLYMWLVNLIYVVLIIHVMLPYECTIPCQNFQYTEQAVVIIKKELFWKTTSYKLGSNITYRCRGHCGPKEDGRSNQCIRIFRHRDIITEKVLWTAGVIDCPAPREPQNHKVANLKQSVLKIVHR